MNNTEKFTNFTNQLCDVKTLIPRRDPKGKKIITQAIYTRHIASLVGIKTATSRFLPVSHEGYSNETYVDKVYDLLGRDRAEFIGGVRRRKRGETTRIFYSKVR